MLIIDDLPTLEGTIASNIDRRIAGILLLRRELIDLATFVVVQCGDALPAVVTAIGYAIESAFQPWEWVLDHDGVFEAPVITSDDGSGVVLIVPDIESIDTTLRDLLRGCAENADSIG